MLSIIFLDFCGSKGGRLVVASFFPSPEDNAEFRLSCCSLVKVTELVGGASISAQVLFLTSHFLPREPDKMFLGSS